MSVIEVSVVMPCLNEALTVGVCVTKALKTLESLGVHGEVIVADNGSTDGSQRIAGEHGARVVSVDRKGYGAALIGGIAAAQGAYIIMADADDSYDFTALAPFIEKLRDGYDLVMGNRFAGGIAPGAMPPLHRYLGNPVLSFIGRLFFKIPVRDFHCGLRGFRKDAAERMGLCTTGMEFASEMVVKASLYGMRICEVPATLSPDGRDRPPHLRSWRDGWRHLRFLLIYSPRWLFLYPGIFLIMLGLVVGGTLILAGIPRTNSLLVAMAMIFMGTQSVFFAVAIRTFSAATGLLPPSKLLERFKSSLTLEIGVAIGAMFCLLGVAGFVSALTYWATVDFGPLSTEFTQRIVVPSTAALVIGPQIVLNFFMVSILTLEHTNQKHTT